jgi:hypothetical protein
MSFASAVVAFTGAVLVASSPGRPCPPEGVGGDVDQRCQETSDLGEGERDEAAARSFGAIAAVTER